LRAEVREARRAMADRRRKGAEARLEAALIAYRKALEQEIEGRG